MTNKKICSIFGDIQAKDVKGVRKTLFLKLEEFVKDEQVNEFHVGHFGAFHFLAMSVCAELKEKHNVSVIQICTPHSIRNMAVGVKKLFGNIESTAYYDNYSNRDPVIHAIDKTITASDVILFHVDKKEFSDDTHHALEFAKSLNKKIVFLNKD